MHLVKFPMHADDGLVSLRQVLERLPPNDLLWHVFEFEAYGTAPNGMSMEEFERATLSSDEGYTMRWPDLVAFSQGIDQTLSCLIAGAVPGTQVTLVDGQFPPDSEITVEAFDSTEWLIGFAKASDLKYFQEKEGVVVQGVSRHA